jgi:hypothetical protein
MKPSRRSVLLTSAVVLASTATCGVVGYYSLVIFGLYVYSHNTAHRADEYQPVDAAGQPLPEWSETVEQVRFSMPPLSLRSGSCSTIFLHVTNASDKEVVLVGGQALTYGHGRAVEAKVFDGPQEVALRAVPAGQSKEVGLFWEFGTSLDQVLGPEVTWVCRVRIGKSERTLQAPMQRQ